MSYITREDGERFVIPSYRDVITAKNSSALKREVALLCKSYGDYVAIQKINPMRFEAAFSFEPGYLLGESIWYQLKRPDDLIYCEAIPGTSEAILVIVKNSSVYLDGRFPIESIPDELIIFLTQKNHFDIYTYGDVPISETPEEGKFSFDGKSVKAFTRLEKPLFPTLPLLKMYQLQLMEPALEGLGVGAFPVKKFVVGIVIVALVWFMWVIITEPKESVTQIITAQIDPFQGYEGALTSPSPDYEITNLMRTVNVLMTMPGWAANKIDYSNGKLVATVTSDGTSIATLENWASRNGATVDITSTAMKVTMNIPLLRRPSPKTIYTMKDVIEKLTDKLAFVYPGNVLKLGEAVNRGPYMEETVTVNILDSSPMVIMLIGNQFKDMPLVLQSVSLTGNNGFFNGVISLKALGS